MKHCVCIMLCNVWNCVCIYYKKKIKEVKWCIIMNTLYLIIDAAHFFWRLRL